MDRVIDAKPAVNEFTYSYLEGSLFEARNLHESIVVIRLIS